MSKTISKVETLQRLMQLVRTNRRGPKAVPAPGQADTLRAKKQHALQELLQRVATRKR